MAAIAMTYVVNPFSVIWHKWSVFFQTLGYAKAAAELARQGYHKEARNCIELMKKLK